MEKLPEKSDLKFFCLP